MTPDELVRAWFREVWNEGREEAIDRMARDAQVHGLGGPDDAAVAGAEQFKSYFHTMRASFGGFDVQVARTIVQGDMVAAHCHVKARHVGEALGGPATGRPVDFWGITIARVSGGQIVEGWNCFDFLAMYQQIGWLQHPVLPQ